jgi:hypothetical protein
VSKHLTLLAAVFFAAPIPLSFAANTPSVSASVSGYTAIGLGTIPESQWEHIAVTRNDGPLHAQASGEGGRFFSTPIGIGLQQYYFTSASARGFAAADPGVLHVYGSDLAIAQPAIIGPNLPVSPNTQTVYTNIQAGAAFTDYLTVNVAGAAIGSAVQVPLRYVVEVVSDTALGYPQYSAHPITVGASFNIPGYGPQNFSTETNLFFFQHTTLPNGNGLYVVRSDVVMVDTHVGDVLEISAAFGISGQANITDANRQVQFGAFADGRNTAGIWLGDLPAGMTISSASGHDYRIDPTTIAAIPEPESYAMMLVGLGMVAFMNRRRRKNRG